MSSGKGNVFASGAMKLLCFPEKLMAWRAGAPFVPVTLEIQPTERCNHRCPNCQGRYSMPTQELRQRAIAGVDLDLSLLDSVWQDPPRGVVLSGHTGDPLLHPHIVDLLAELGRRGIDTVLITNGEGITSEIAAAAVRVCVGIRISLDAYDSRSFRMTHGVGEASWQRVLGGIRLLLEARTAAGIDPTACLIGVGYLTDDRTRPGMLSATQLSKVLAVDYIQFRPFHYRACDIRRELAECRLLEEKGKLAVLASTQKYDLIYRTERHYNACHGSMFYSALDPRGDLYICCHHVTEPEARVGSLREQSWQEFIQHESRRRLASRFPKRSCVPLCRLHPHNEFLQVMITNKEISLAAPTGLVALHGGLL
jgi:radical SAM protein with 4Fe4S-binding SPASM domain